MKCRILAAFVIAMLWANFAKAIVVNLEPTIDAPIKQFMVDTNFRDAALSTRSATNNDQRSVLQFSLASIPAGRIISSATLNLYGHSISGSTDSSSVSAFRVTRNWLENEVTYRRATNAADWTQLGGDYVGTTNVYDVSPYATWTGPQSGSANAWYTWDVKTLVQEWYSGARPNQGLLLKGATGNELEYASSEDTVVANRPYLQVNYVVPEPAGLTLLVIAMVGMHIRRR